MTQANLHPSTREAIADINGGIRVDRSDTSATAWPNPGSFNLFTITGGQILMILMRQEVTGAAVSATAGTIKYHITTAAPYAAATVDFTGASAVVTSAAIGATITVVATALNTVPLLQTTIGPQLYARTAPLVLTPGIVGSTNTGANVTGLAGCVIVTSIWYIPLEDGARVVAA